MARGELNGGSRLVVKEAPVAYHARILDFPVDQRPRERLREIGAKYLSDAELMAILLRTGIKGQNVVALSQQLLVQVGGLSALSDVAFGRLCELKGISEAKACQLLAAVELGRRVADAEPVLRRTISCPQDVVSELGSTLNGLKQEELYVLLLNTKNKVLSKETVYKGSVNSAAVRVAEVLRPAIRENCPSIVMAHNHPSGDPTPSPEDVAVTRRIRTSAEAMDIELLDHVIIGSRGFVSLKERGLGF